MAAVTGLTTAKFRSLDNMNMNAQEVSDDAELILYNRGGGALSAGYISSLYSLYEKLKSLEPDPGDAVWHWLDEEGEPILNSRVTNYGSPYLPGRFRRDKGVVRLEGLLKYDGGPTDVNLFTLPEGFRPPMDIVCTGNGNIFTATASTPVHYHAVSLTTLTIFIEANGKVSVNSPNYFYVQTHISLSGIVFRV